MTSNLRRSVLHALAWVSGARLVGQLLGWAMTLYVIRLLTPQDYGIMALAMLFISLMTPLTELGLGAALVQSESVSAKLKRQVLGFALTVSIGAGMLLLVIAPLAASLFETPTLAPVLQVLALALMLSAFAVVPRALLHRRLNLRTLSLIELGGSLSGGALTLLLAYSGHGVWSLIWGFLFTLALTAALLVSVTAAPVWPTLNFRGLRKTLAFGSWVTLDRLMWVMWSQVDIFIIGMTLGDTRLGNYSVAKNLAQLPQTKVQGAINAVALPAYAEAHRSGADPEHYLHKYIRLSALLSFPVFWGIAATAPVLVPLVLGDGWLNAVVPLQIIASVMPVRIAQAAVTPYLQAIGQARLSFINMAIGLVLMTLAVGAGSMFGLAGVSLGWAAAAVAILLIVLVRTARVTGISAMRIPRELIHAAIPAVVMVVCVVAIDHLLDMRGFLELGVMVLAGAVLYVMSVLLLCRAEALELMRLFRPGPSRPHP